MSLNLCSASQVVATAQWEHTSVLAPKPQLYLLLLLEIILSNNKMVNGEKYAFMQGLFTLYHEVISSTIGVNDKK